MRNSGQKGFAHIFVVLILLAGIAGGLYLVRHPQILKSRATSTAMTIDEIKTACPPASSGSSYYDCQGRDLTPAHELDFSLFTPKTNIIWFRNINKFAIRHPYKVIIGKRGFTLNIEAQDIDISGILSASVGVKNEYLTGRYSNTEIGPGRGGKGGVLTCDYAPLYCDTFEYASTGDYGIEGEAGDDHDDVGGGLPGVGGYGGGGIVLSATQNMTISPVGQILVDGANGSDAGKSSGNADFGGFGGGGGGGGSGGEIVLKTNGILTINNGAIISAKGGNGGAGGAGFCSDSDNPQQWGLPAQGGDGGSGGRVRIFAKSIAGSISDSVKVTGGAAGIGGIRPAKGDCLFVNGASGNRGQDGNITVTIPTPVPTPTPTPTPTPLPITKTGFTLSAPKTSYAVGEEIPVSLFANSDTENANLFSAKIIYASNVFELDRVDTSPAFIKNWVEQSSWLGQYQSSVNAGYISLVGGVPNPGVKTQVGSNNLMAIIYFKALSQAGVTIFFDDSSAIFSNTGNTNILTLKTPVNITITRGAAPTPTRTPTPTPTPTPAPTPAPPVATPNPGTGDGNKDGRIDLTDLSILLSDINKTSGFRTAIDLNGDGLVNSFDFSLMRNLLIQKNIIKE